MRKQMEGDNIQRRQKAREARADEGVPASQAQVTLGASKGREHLPHKADEEERQQTQRGKQRSDVDRGPKKR
ncbi:hypothetical protein CFP66_36740 [Pseudonocardia sp. MH-G8]|nr:hypothetical protein CFP66_36740 [Pseudonocardia sp. MH-G8]